MPPPELPGAPPLIALTLNGGVVGYADRLAVAADGTAAIVGATGRRARFSVSGPQLRRLRRVVAGIEVDQIAAAEPCERAEGADVLVVVFEIHGERVGCGYEDQDIARRVEPARSVAGAILRAARERVAPS